MNNQWRRTNRFEGFSVDGETKSKDVEGEERAEEDKEIEIEELERAKEEEECKGEEYDEDDDRNAEILREDEADGGQNFINLTFKNLRFWFSKDLTIWLCNRLIKTRTSHWTNEMTLHIKIHVKKELRLGVCGRWCGRHVDFFPIAGLGLPRFQTLPTFRSVILQWEATN
jgi:hypothetical protein